ncbi:sensor domain-containing protein, partial [Streptomyces scabiei]
MIRTVLREVPRAVAYLLSGVLVGAPLLVVLLVLGVLGLALAPVLVGLPLLAVAVVSGIPVGALERRRLALTRTPPPPGPH